jgi:lysozyme
MSVRNKIIGSVAGLAMASALPFVAKHEGLSNWAYKDAVGVNTICYGSTVGVRMGDYKTNPECDALLEKELLQFMQQVNRSILIPVRPNVPAAMASFSYNIGIGAFKSSAALKLINTGNIALGCEAIATKDYSSGKCRGYGCGWAGGKMLRGLQKRRIEEMELCLQ